MSTEQAANRSPGTVPGTPAGGQGAWQLGPVGFFAVVVVSLGGPLALAALYAPGIVAGVPGAAGLVPLAGAVAFLFPLGVWLRYARHVAGPAGLAGFVEQAAGRRVAMVQAGVWTISYALYLLYTGAYVVYDVLPAVLPGVAPYRPVLAILLPAGVAAIVLAPRRVTFAVLGLLAAGQLVLTGWLAVLGIRGANAPEFAPAAPAAALGSAAGNVALLYICGSLPLFLGGEVARPAVTVRRGLGTAYALVAVLVTLAVLPMAAMPGVAGTEVPGMLLATAFAGRSAGIAVGLGAAASIVGVMLVEYLAVTRLLHAMVGLRVRPVAVTLAVALVAAGPISLLVGPETFYTGLLRPSLAALWVSQLIVVAVYPRFARQRGRLRAIDVVLAAGAAALMVFGLYSSVVNQIAS